MSLFLTAYTAGDGTYGAYIEAEDRAHALTLAAQRGVGERIEGEIEGRGALNHKLLGHIRASRWLEAAHEASFLGFVGVSSGALTAADVLSDRGLVHELLHLAIFKPEDTGDRRERRALIKRVKAMAMDFEWRTPGWQRSYSGQPGVRTHINDRRTPQRDAGA